MKKCHFAMLAIMLALGLSAHEQTLADYQFSTGHDATLWYTLDSTRNLLADGSYLVRRSFVEEIGFSFPFVDTSYTRFSVTLAGVVRLGGTRALSSPSSKYQGSPFFPANVNYNRPKLDFFGCYGYYTDSSYVHSQVFGTAPNRVLVLDFALQTYNSSSRHSLLRYQMHLHENGNIQVVYHSQPPVLLPMASRQQGMSVDSSDVLIVDENHVTTHFTSGYSTYISAGHWPDTNRYYLFEYPNDVCQMPTGLTVSSIDTSSVSLSWNNPASASTFVVEYATSMLALGTGQGTAFSLTDTTTVVTGLQSNTQYYFYVRSICDGGDTSNAAFISAQTLAIAPVSDFPYSCDFEFSEDRQGWYLPSGNLSTMWYIDTAVNNTQNGQYSLYISQDGGLTNTGGDEWMGAYAYRDFNLEAGDWSITFDWRAVGETTTNSEGNTIFYHFLRAFLVPSSVSFTSRTPPSFPATPHSTAVPNGWINLVPTSNSLAGQSNWTTHTVTVSIPTSGCYHLVYYWETDGYEPDVDMPAAIDNIYIERYSCAQPSQLTAAVNDDEMLLNWHRGGNESLWMIRYNGNEVYVQDTFYLVTNLETNTLYTFEVYAVCGEYDTSLATVGTFRSSLGEPVISLPYYCDFEDSLECRGWVTLNSGQINGWYIGTAANNTSQGLHSLYVSQDSGATNTYSGTAYSTSYAYRQLLLNAGSYFCSFDWRCQGDTDYHFMRAFIVPAASIPTEGSFPNVYNHYTFVPSGWIDMNETTHFMSGHNDWTTQIQNFSIADSGLYALLLMWDNDDYTPQNPPAAVDNISIGYVTCPMPEDLQAEVMQTMVNLTWTAGSDASIWLVEYGDTALITYTPFYAAQGLTPNTEYTFRISKLCTSGDTSLAATLTVRTDCEAVTSLPYICDFENYAIGTGNNDNFIPCWHRVRNYTGYSPYVTDSYSSGNNYLYWNLTAGLLDDVYVSLPELDESIEVRYTELRFKAMAFDFFGFNADPVFIVGVMADPTDPSTFTPVDTVVVTSDTGYVEYTVPMLDYTASDQYVAIRGTLFGSNNTSAVCLMDDIELHELQFCHAPSSISAVPGIDTIALSWTPGGDETEWLLRYDDTVVTTQQPSFIARNLLANTEYLFSVSAICNPGDTSDAVSGRCRTLASPQDPPDTTVCLVPTHVDYYQVEPWADHAYEFHFSWSGDAPAYEVSITRIDPELQELYTVTDTTFFFDAEGESGDWTMMVRSLCNDTLNSDWSNPIYFSTPVCIGIDNPSETANVTLYPNPAGDVTTLAISGIYGTATATVVDLTGRIVMSLGIRCSGTTTVELPLDSLSAGTYFVRIATSDTNVVRKLIVKP